MSIGVFGVEPRALQLTWGSLPAREIVLEVAGRLFEIDATPPPWYPAPDPGGGGPGGLVVDGLEPGTDYEVILAAPGRPRTLAVVATTAPSPPGRVLCRFATVSDCHIGERRFGAAGRITDPAARTGRVPPYPIRSLRAARLESEAWGAEHLVARGDVTRHGTSADATAAAAELAGSQVPVYAVLGNHDVAGPADVAEVLRATGVAVAAADRAVAVDLPGVRLVLGHSPVRGSHGGRLTDRHLDQLVEMVGDAPGPAVLVLHHPPRAGGPPTYYPPSLSPADSRRLVERVTATGRPVMALSGHTHRTRRYDVGPLPVAEVGSTKDYPGQWAGYTVYEGGIGQWARRTGAPDVIAWTEMTRRALGGVWGRWSPGRLSDRSWLHQWDTSRRRPVTTRRAGR